MPIVTIGNNTGNTFAGTDDTFLREDAPTVNQDSAYLEIIKSSAGTHRGSLLTFTGLSNLPSNITVNSATLNLWLGNWGDATVITVDVHRMIQSWAEATANWNTYNGVNNWNTGGALGADIDHDSVVSASSAITVSAAYKSFTSAQLAQDIQDIANGVAANNGFLMLRNGAGNDGAYSIFASSEGVDGQRPYLVIDYTEFAGVTVSGSLAAGDATLSGAVTVITPVTEISGNLQADSAEIFATSTNDPVSAIVTTTVITSGGVVGSVQAQDATVSGSITVIPDAVNVTVAGNLQAQSATIDASVLVVPPQTVIVVGSAQAQEAFVSGAVLLFTPYQFKYTTVQALFDAFGKTELALIIAPEQTSVTGDLLYAVLTSRAVSAWTLQQIADANVAAQRLYQIVLASERFIDSYISPRYKLPLTQILIDQSSLAEFCNDIVRYKLMDDRTTDEVEKRYAEATRWLRDVANGRASLGAQDTAVATPSGRMTTRTGTSKHNWDSY